MLSNLFHILKQYLSNRIFKVYQNEYLTTEFEIHAGVPQGSVLGPVLYLIFTADLPTSTSVMTSTFADDTAVMSSHHSALEASNQLQLHIQKIAKWLGNWRIQVNPIKSTHITFTLRTETCPYVYLNNIIIPQSKEVKYLGIHLDRRLTWQKHLNTKIIQMKLKAHQINWLLNSKSKLAIEHKVLLYKAILQPIWQYGAQLWSTTSKSNIAKMQTAQSKILRFITNAPNAIHDDLIID